MLVHGELTNCVPLCSNTVFLTLVSYSGHMTWELSCCLSLMGLYAYCLHLPKPPYIANMWFALQPFLALCSMFTLLYPLPFKIVINFLSKDNFCWEFFRVKLNMYNFFLWHVKLVRRHRCSLQIWIKCKMGKVRSYWVGKLYLWDKTCIFKRFWKWSWLIIKKKTDCLCVYKTHIDI